MGSNRFLPPTREVILTTSNTPAVRIMSFHDICASEIIIAFSLSVRRFKFFENFVLHHCIYVYLVCSTSLQLFITSNGWRLH